jgi:hypothetical protein
MKFYFIAGAFVISLLAGCGGESGDEITLPSKAFSNDYQRSDFNLAADYSFWEIRLGSLPTEDIYKFQVIERFDSESYQTLDDVQRQHLDTTVSQTGFSQSCLPSFCAYYAVAIKNDTTVLIDSTSDLLEFFSEIDTEAELKIRLDYAQDYKAKTIPLLYEVTEGGYLVLLNWDTLCQLRGQDLVKVHKNGKIEKIREISAESYSSCV